MLADCVSPDALEASRFSAEVSLPDDVSSSYELLLASLCVMAEIVFCTRDSASSLGALCVNASLKLAASLESFWFDERVDWLLLTWDEPDADALAEDAPDVDCCSDD